MALLCIIISAISAIDRITPVSGGPDYRRIRTTEGKLRSTYNRAKFYVPVTWLPLHYNGEIRGTENCDRREITSLLLRG